MAETWKSGQWRICSWCLTSIEPRDRVAVMDDDIICMDCYYADEDKEEEHDDQ